MFLTSYREKEAQFYKEKERRLPKSNDYYSQLHNAILYQMYYHYNHETWTEDKVFDLIGEKHESLYGLFDGEGFAILELLFENKASMIRDIWKRTFDFGYQSGFERRPFRTKHSIGLHYRRMISFLSGFAYLSVLNFNLEEYLKDPNKSENTYFTYNSGKAISYTMAHEIDKGNNNVMKMIEHIVYENTGSLNYTVLKALAMSKSGWAHEILEKLLLSAQLQEGLRQSIVELIDEGDADNFIYLLKVILDNKMERFSSVVRAFDVWTGLPVSAEKSKTARYYLEVIYDCVANRHEEKYLASPNPVENHIALMCIGFYELQDVYKVLDDFLGNNDPAKRIAGWYLLSQTADPQAQLEYFIKYNDERTPDVLAYMADSLVAKLKYGHELMFEKLLKMINETPIKTKTVSYPGMQELTRKYSQEFMYNGLVDLAKSAGAGLKDSMFDTLCDYYERIPVDTRIVFVENLSNNMTTKKHRQTILNAACDKSKFVRIIAASKLKEMKLSEEEYMELESMLRHKTESLRKNIMVLLLEQSPEDCLESVRRLHNSQDANCKLAARQMVMDMQSDSRFEKVLSKAKEIVSMEEVVAESDEDVYGLVDYGKLTKLAVPKKKPSYKFKDALPDLMELEKKVHKLTEVVKRHVNEVYYSENEEIVYGSERSVRVLKNKYPRKYNLDDYPYGTEFREEISKLFTRQELIQAVFYFSLVDHRALSLETMKLFNLSYNKNIHRIPYCDYVKTYLNAALEEVTDKYTFYFDVALDLYYNYSHRFLEKELPNMSDAMRQVYEKDDNLHFCIGHKNPVVYWMNCIYMMDMSSEEFKDYFHLAYGYTKAMNFKTSAYIGLKVLARAYKEGIINENDVCYFMTLPGFEQLMDNATLKRNESFRKNNKEFMEIVNRIIDKVIETEINRGEAPSRLSPLAGKINRCYGSYNFAKIVCAMNERNYVRGYNFAGGNSTKGQTLSFLLKNLYPKEGENAHTLGQIKEFKKLGVQKIVDAAMYAPQWLGIVEEYLMVPGLQKAGVWFHAHLNEYFTEEKNALVARYSSISPMDFKAGAFDSRWFREALSEVGEKNFALLYKAAKYIAGGNLHKRSQLFADSVRGKLDKSEVFEKVAESRNKDYLLGYTLMPYESQEELLERYMFVENFRKESRQFGAMRRQSEAQAYDIAIQNLARIGGYEDTNRFVWQMESLKLDSVRHWFESVKVDELILTIEFDEEGIASMKCTKDDKVLKSVPAAYKNHPVVAEGLEVVKSLKEQQKRARKTLERAMVHRDAFTKRELELLARNPVLGPSTKKLLFVSSGFVGFFADGFLVDFNGSMTQVDENIYIAHPYDLMTSKTWHDWQKHFYTERIKQPFKQVFREYYCPNVDELKEKTISRRYAGHQLQPQKAARLAEERLWNTSEGLFKVYFKEHIMVSLNFESGWFSPMDIEVPTIHSVEFFNTDNWNVMNITEVPPVLFSEAMRDIDLLVSAAHYGSVDPEASLSTIEMRTALINVLLPLLKIDNVTINKSHALIKGEFGEYTVHLGSGVAHMQAKGMMPILPVHSSHRGRVFLPFADDDLKTAEVLTKIVMLAEDKKIKDPVILGFIRS